MSASAAGTASAAAAGTTVADLLRTRLGDANPGLKHGDRVWTWDEHVRECAGRARWLLELGAGEPVHVGVLLDNVPEFSFLLGGAALARSVVVGLNATRSPAELARDVAHTRCRVVVTAPAYRHLVEEVDVPVVTEVPAAPADVPDVHAAPGDLFALIFTSGTTSAPKAVRCSQGRIARQGSWIAQGFGLGPDDCAYVAMPLFHSNALIAGWTPALAAGAAIALRDRFSASAFLDDVRRFGATYANYVGTPLAYVLAQAERPDDGDNPLRVVFGNEAAEGDIRRFASRFGCRVVDAYGSTEGGIAVSRTEDTPPGALGRPVGDVVVVDEHGEECPPGVVGELVNRGGAGSFEGYWDNPEADAERLRDGWYWSGDLAYRDDDGYLYFAGRTSDWLRVHGENLAVAPIERVLLDHPDVVQAAVYPLPDPSGVGDEVAAALVLREGARLDADAFSAWLDARSDLGRKARPRWLRVVAALPTTATNKVVRRELVAAGRDGAVPIP